MRIALGSDHAGFHLKKCIEGSLKESSLMTGDFGAEGSEKPWDYPDVAFEVGARVARREFDLGILVCGTGIGMSIAANKIPGVRAALAYDEETGRLAREHNDANILTLGGRKTDCESGIKIVRAWLSAEFQGSRHALRVGKIVAFEEGNPSTGNKPDGSPKLVTFDHPLIQHKIGVIRDRHTSVKVFRELVQEIAGLMVYETTGTSPGARFGRNSDYDHNGLLHLREEDRHRSYTEGGVGHGRRHATAHPQCQGGAHRHIQGPRHAGAPRILL